MTIISKPYSNKVFSFELDRKTEIGLKYEQNQHICTWQNSTEQQIAKKKTTKIRMIKWKASKKPYMYDSNYIFVFT